MMTYASWVKSKPVRIYFLLLSKEALTLNLDVSHFIWWMLRDSNFADYVLYSLDIVGYQLSNYIRSFTSPFPSYVSDKTFPEIIISQCTRPQLEPINWHN